MISYMMVALLAMAAVGCSDDNMEKTECCIVGTLLYQDGAWQIEAVPAGVVGDEMVVYLIQDYPIEQPKFRKVEVSAEGLGFAYNVKAVSGRLRGYYFEERSLTGKPEPCGIFGILLHQDGGWQVQSVMKGNAEVRTDTFYMVTSPPK